MDNLQNRLKVKLGCVEWLASTLFRYICSKGTCGNGKTKTPSSMITVEIKDVVGVYFLVGGGVVLGFIFLIFECLFFTRKLVHLPDTVSYLAIALFKNHFAQTYCKLLLLSACCNLSTVCDNKRPYFHQVATRLLKPGLLQLVICI